MRLALLFRFTQPAQNGAKEHYAQQLKALIQSTANRHGDLDERAVMRVVEAGWELLDLAGQRIAQKDFQDSMFIATAILEELTPVMEFAEDENHDLVDLVDRSIELLREITLQDLPETFRLHLFKYSLDSYKGGKFCDWNWHTDLLTIACEATKTEEEFTQVRSLLARADGWQHNEAYSKKLMHALLGRIRGSEAADEFMLQHLENRKFRKLAINKAIEAKDFVRAKSLAQEGIAKDKNERPGVVAEWMQFLLQIAEQQGDNKALIESTEWLLQEDRSKEEYYYQVLKNNVKPNHWKKYLEGLIQKISSDDQRFLNGLVANIYIWEACWDKLFELVKAYPSLMDLDKYASHLKKNYREELVDLYEPLVVRLAENSSCRRDYQEVCRCLRKMKKLGGSKTVLRLIATFRFQFMRRPAFLQELDNV